MLEPRLTVADVLRLPEVTVGEPEILWGTAVLDRPVSWIHVAEHANSGHLLDGGEILLATGVGWPHASMLRRGFIAECAAHGASAVIIELGARWKKVPVDIIDACRDYLLPLIVLHKETRFASITRAVHNKLLLAQIEINSASQEVAETFLTLIHTEAPTEEIIDQCSRFLQCPVILEDVSHRVIYFTERHDTHSNLLESWAEISSLISQSAESRIESDSPRLLSRPFTPSAFDDPDAGSTTSMSGKTKIDGITWTYVIIQSQGAKWGRLLFKGESSFPAGGIYVLSQAAVALSIDRLGKRGDYGWNDLLQRTLMSRLLGSNIASRKSITSLLLAGGFQLNGRDLLGLEIISEETPMFAASTSDAFKLAVPSAGTFARSSLNGFRTTMAVSLPQGTQVDEALNSFYEQLMSQGWSSIRIATGIVTSDIDELVESIQQARRMVTTGWNTEEIGPILIANRQSLSVLMSSIAEDVRLQDFAESLLQPILHFDSKHGTNLMKVLECELRHSNSRSIAAKELGISRTSYYNKLETIKRLLKVDLDDSDSAFALNLAVHSYKFKHN